MESDQGVRYEITVDGKTRTHRDRKEIAFEAARYLKTIKGNTAVAVRDLTTGQVTVVGPITD